MKPGTGTECLLRASVPELRPGSGLLLAGGAGLMPLSASLLLNEAPRVTRESGTLVRKTKLLPDTVLILIRRDLKGNFKKSYRI